MTRPIYPFSAIVGQGELKLALIVSVIERSTSSDITHAARQTRTRATVNSQMKAFIRAVWSNDQLTDGGPSVTPELPNRVAGPPFGGASGSGIRAA